MSFHRSPSTSGVQTPSSSSTSMEYSSSSSTSDPPTSSSILQKLRNLVSSGELTGQNNKQFSYLAADIEKKLEYLDSEMKFANLNSVISESDRKKLLSAVNNLTSTNPSVRQKIFEAVITRAQEVIGKSQSDGTGDKNINDNYSTIKDVLQKYYARSRIADILKKVKLTEEERRSLFEKQLKGEESWSQLEKHPKLLEIGKQIAEKCEGVRLVVERVAKGLAAHRDQNNWELVRDNFAECLKVLLYDEYLPRDLKPCFSYCCLFPEDHQIDVQTLITMWMALDMIKGKERDSRELEEIGTEYVEELVNKGLLISESKDVTGTTVTACKMHPLIRQLAIHVAPEHGISPHIYAGDDFVKQVANIPKEVGHVSFTLGPDALLHHSVSPSQIPKELSTLLIFLSTADAASSSSTSKANILEKRLTAFQAAMSRFTSTLRVLSLNNSRTIPDSLPKLTKLQYLDLSKSTMDELPDAITQLTLLQTLKLSYCLLLKELPKDMGKLKNLRHLIIDGCDALTGMPPDLAQLTELRSLSRFLVRDDNSSSKEKANGLRTRWKNRNDTETKGGSDPPHRLQELGALTKLSGNLEILYLHRIKNNEKPESEAEKAKLHEKEDLEGLTLKWHGPSGEGLDEGKQDADSTSTHKATLEGLKPHPNLKRLFLDGYKGETFPGWTISSESGTLKNLVKLTLYNCPNCKYLPPLNGLSSLKALELLRLHTMEYIEEKEYPSSSAAPAPLGSLKEVNLSFCPKLKRWNKSTKTTPKFACLSKLQIRYCPLLTSMPLFPDLEDQLILINASLEPLRHTIKMNSASGNQYRSLSKLKRLYIEKAHEQDPPAAKFSLRDHRLSLSSLEYLKIKDSQLFNLFEEDNDNELWESLEKLNSLTVWGISELQTLPEGLLKVTSLKYLRVFNCPKLGKLPEPINHLKSLERLVISKCPRMSSLPNGLEDLKSLKSLVIEDCPNLLARCHKDTGEDWPKIQSIPNFSLKSSVQDWE